MHSMQHQQVHHHCAPEARLRIRKIYQRSAEAPHPQRRLQGARCAATGSTSEASEAGSTCVPSAVAKGFDSIPDALAAIRDGQIVVVLDDESRENEGDLIMAADKATTAAMHAIIEYTSGVVCVGMEGSDLDRLSIPLMINSRENDESMYTAFTVTVDLREGTSTGISAADRAATIRALADPAASPSDFRRPGHIFPLRSRPGGVLARPGHTEASVDLSRLAGCAPMGVMCEVVNRHDGSMARTPQLLELAAQQGWKCVTIADLIRHRLATEQLLVPVGPAREAGTPRGHVVQAQQFAGQHVQWDALVFSSPGLAARTGASAPLLAVRREDVLADVFGLQAGSASGAVSDALEQVAEQGGVLVYLRPRQQQQQGTQSPGQLPEHLDKALAGMPAAAGRVVELACALSAVRQLGLQQVCLLDAEAGDADTLAHHFGMQVSGTVALHPGAGAWAAPAVAHSNGAACSQHSDSSGARLALNGRP